MSVYGFAWLILKLRTKIQPANMDVKSVETRSYPYLEAVGNARIMEISLCPRYA